MNSYRRSVVIHSKSIRALCLGSVSSQSYLLCWDQWFLVVLTNCVSRQSRELWQPYVKWVHMRQTREIHVTSSFCMDFPDGCCIIVVHGAQIVLVRVWNKLPVFIGILTKKRCYWSVRHVLRTFKINQEQTLHFFFLFMRKRDRAPVRGRSSPCTDLLNLK